MKTRFKKIVTFLSIISIMSVGFAQENQLNYNDGENSTKDSEYFDHNMMMNEAVGSETGANQLNSQCKAYGKDIFVIWSTGINITQGFIGINNRIREILRDMTARHGAISAEIIDIDFEVKESGGRWKPMRPDHYNPFTTRIRYRIVISVTYCIS